MAEASRVSASKVLCRVCTGGYADILLDSELSGLPPELRPFTTELVYGVLRSQVRIDYIISAFASVKPEKMEHKVLTALRLGVYQLLFLSGVPVHAAINESVELVRSLGRKRAGFVNGVLRRINLEGRDVRFPDIRKESVRHITFFYSHPEWIVRRWVDRYGIEGAVELCKANLEPPSKSIRVNRIKVPDETGRKELVEDLEKAGFTVNPNAYAPDGLELEGRGRLGARGEGVKSRFYIQDIGSQLISCLLSPEPGASVLDACAAPGGKSVHLAALMENRGSLYALERNKARAERLEVTLKRFGVTNSVVLRADSELPLKLGSNAPNEFDYVLCDAPCSGLGVLGRAPDIKARRKEADLADLSRRQKRLMENLSAYVKPGGVLVYSVCSGEPEESTEVIDTFLTKHPDFSIESGAEHLPPSCLSLVDERGFLKTLRQSGMDCFFAARLRRHG